MMNLFVFLLVLSFSSYIICSKSCHEHKSCGKCRSDVSASCVWCSNKKNKTHKCQPKSYLETHKDWCKDDLHTYKPYLNVTKVINETFTSNIQLRPQHMEVIASPGAELKINVQYKPAQGFPLDVYFLMDYSYTMKHHSEALISQALSIYESLTKLTNNVVLGMGSFVEKPGLPYTDININNNEKLTYSFKNHLSLTKQVEKFKTVVARSEFGSNYDDAEAGLDALMQVMKCEKELGWRTQTRRIIVLATDNTYHSAGDGKMLGAIKPMTLNTTCRMEGDEYKRKESLKYDYPSVSLINKVAKEGNFKIIFAGLNKVKSVYEALSKQISSSRYAELKEKSNIYDIIENVYKESVRDVIIKKDASNAFDVRIDQNCSSVPKKNCEFTGSMDYVTIPVTIKSISKCQTTAEPENITIYPEGLPDKLTVTFKVDCQCNCESIAADPTTRKDCSDKGSILCGACKCDKNWGGDICEINCSDENAREWEKKCYVNNTTSSTSEICNGHGTCQCGKCTCSDDFTGEVCQYDPNSCDVAKNGLICGGKDHGSCRNLKCECLENEWEGKACDCPVKEKSDKLCTGPFSKKKCSGHGDCVCGKCNCKKKASTNEMYSGAFCDDCEECATERCRELEDYAMCNHKQSKDICDEKFALTKEMNLDVLVANKSTLNRLDDWKMGTQCRTLLDDDTYLLFRYKADTKTGTALIMIQIEVEIPPKANIWIPIASAIAGILIIGILTIVFWKLLVEWHDKREYNKFCNEAASQGYDVTQNPLYAPPTQNFVNPGFNQNIQ